jgi:hypothetical protein
MPRPKLKAPRSYMLRVLLTEQEAERLRALAEAQNTTMSELGRQQIREILAAVENKQQPVTTAA